MIIPLCFLTSYGFVNFAIHLKSRFSKKNFLTTFYLLVSVILTFEFVHFQHYYYTFYPSKTATSWWQYGYKELMTFISNQKDNYEQIIITRENGRPAMYYWFYTQTDPRLVQAWDSQAAKDQGEFLQFENIYFGTQPKTLGKHLIVTTKPQKHTLIKQIKDLNNQTVYYIHSN